MIDIMIETTLKRKWNLNLQDLLKVINNGFYGFSNFHISLYEKIMTLRYAQIIV